MQTEISSGLLNQIGVERIPLPEEELRITAPSVEVFILFTRAYALSVPSSNTSPTLMVIFLMYRFSGGGVAVGSAHAWTAVKIREAINVARTRTMIQSEV